MHHLLRHRLKYKPMWLAAAVLCQPSNLQTDSHLCCSVCRPSHLPALSYKPTELANTNPISCSEDDDSSGGAHSSRTQLDALGGSSDYRDGEESQRRALLGEFTSIAGNQLSDVTYCDKNRFFTGRHSSCFSRMARFFATDAALLHTNLSSSWP